MAKKTVKASARKAVKARTKKAVKKAPAKTASRTKGDARKRTFNVAIQKVLEKMKAIVEAKKENEFLERCAELGANRFVVVDAGIVKLVKAFEAEHRLSHDLRASASISRRAMAPLDDETCF